ncbi:hypothetical protein [Lentzea flava]|uniref:Transporter n=1 Tax=Lentzea flava TaxID=103732 RepID=A0ABQ2V3I8_9PSEU|nr:hypothetical protein [Lentzea flava]MCP2203061.1 ABC-2 family transporter protein [Lentzea flava]GGU65016.1 transporter [Lentzea flava]
MNAFVWLTWRQHRWTIIFSAVLVVLAAYGLISAEANKNTGIDSMPMSGFYGLMVQLSFGGVIGVFWGAPLIARELEERTYFVAWGQDVTPVQWLRGKALVLGVLAAVLGAVAGLGDGRVGVNKAWSAFEGHPAVQAGYALFGLALGVFIGLLSRHVVTAMAATLVFYTLSRTLLAVLLRDHYLPASRSIARWDSTPVVPPGALELGNGFVGKDLSPMSVPEACAKLVNPNSCMRRSGGAAGTYVDFQPVERIEAFRYIEFGLFVALSAVLLALTFRLLRHGGGWKPSRSHRRITSETEPAPASEAAAAQG